MLRQQSDSLLRFFHDMRLIYYSADQLGTTPAKQKVFMGDTNLLISFFGDKENRQLMCETYFLSQMRSVANVEFMANGDFLIGGKYIFAVGDPLRDMIVSASYPTLMRLSTGYRKACLTVCRHGY